MTFAFTLIKNSTGSSEGPYESYKKLIAVVISFSNTDTTNGDGRRTVCIIAFNTNCPSHFSHFKYGHKNKNYSLLHKDPVKINKAMKIMQFEGRGRKHEDLISKLEAFQTLMAI